MITRVLLFFGLFSFELTAAAEVKPRWQAPLASGMIPSCPEHVGARTYRSEIARAGLAAAFISETSRRDERGCEFEASLNIEQGGRQRALKIPEPANAEFSIIDFSPDRNTILIARKRGLYANEYYRNLQLASVNLATGRMKWRDIWDVFGWGKCTLSANMADRHP